jgi:Zn-dependent protease
LPFRCPFCTGYFCGEHRLPEMHECSEIERALQRARERGTEVVSTAPVRTQHYGFEVSPTRVGIGFFSFSQKEMTHLAIGTLIIIVVGLSAFPQILLSPRTMPYIFLGLALVFTSTFLLHEIAHKLAAQHYGLWAEFRLTLFGSLISLLSMFIPFKVVSPGVVHISGVANREVIGKTALAGPSVNLALSMIFVVLHNYFKTYITFAGAFLNPFVAFFNLIPYGIFDGEKVFYWNNRVWGLCFAASIIFMLLAYWLQFSV